jgi:hypothetical protein
MSAGSLAGLAGKMRLYQLPQGCVSQAAYQRSPSAGDVQQW